MSRMDPDNFWYAVNNTEIVVMPRSRLETFGNTNLRYHLVSELMDTVDRIRVREGTIESFRPKILTPTYCETEALEGFGDQARQYVRWLREHAKDLTILQYGFKLQKREISEQVVCGNVSAILDQVKERVNKSQDPMSAVVLGVDDMWDVCLLKLLVDVVRNSAPGNVSDLKSRRMLEDSGGVPLGVRAEIERAFLQASRDPRRIGELYQQLRKYGLFSEYEDRFFALTRRPRS